jgi:hypothetical protein
LLQIGNPTLIVYTNLLRKEWQKGVMLAQLATTVRQPLFSHQRWMFDRQEVRREGGAAAGGARLLFPEIARQGWKAGENRSFVTNEALTELASLRRDL